MGVSMYLRWPGQTEDEQTRQYTGFSSVSGQVGYLYESYGGPKGAPLASKVLVPEGFIDGGGWPEGVPVSAATLQERLPEALEALRAQYTDRYPEDTIKRVLRSWVAFVELAAEMEVEHGSVAVYVSW